MLKILSNRIDTWFSPKPCDEQGLGVFFCFYQVRRRTLAQLRAFAVGADAISLPRRKEMAKEKTLRGKPLRTPLCATAK
ncbi:MAG: hypothetical protein E7625_02145 [Ruminococcaceae bacterium]|nr:hypothetical protein [Oscillospiraceae bacterium]